MTKSLLTNESEPRDASESSYDDDGSDLNDSTGVGTVASTDNSETAIGKHETQQVFRQKLVVFLVLLISAIATSVTVFCYVKDNEEEQFNLKFEDDAHKLLEAIGVSFDRLLGAFDSVAVTLVSYSHLANKTWPFVTVPDFAHRMSKLLPLSDALYINVLPVVSPKERNEWEQYSITNDQWVSECMTLQDSWEGYFGLVDLEVEHIEHVHGDSGNIPKNIDRIMLPSWQSFPVIAKTKYTYNYDWLSSKRNEAIISCMETKFAIVSQPYMVSQPVDVEYEEETYLAKYLKNFVRSEEEAFEPVSDLWYPIIDASNEVASETGIEEYNTTENKVVGVIGTTVYWRDTFNNVLPPHSDGIHIVVTNPCSNAFTYQIMGERVVFLGVGDLHEPAYNHHGVSDTLYDLEKLALRGMVYTGAEMNEEFCPITIFLFPSNVMKKTFTTNNGAMFAGAAICIFAFTSLVFYLYDLKVEQRQKHVLNKAVRSSAIVSSLFPSAVRDRLYPVTEEPAKNKLEALIPETAKGKLQSFLRDGKTSTPSTVESSSSLPIAELYPETTVLFADIAGFTAWSSERQPTQVFHLLETVYAAFDEIAKRRGVFKVETIGDSYVAVVGLPTPRKHHAVVMTRFANDCRIKMNELTHDLDKVLGPGTADLSMRFGLNSGPTTAGVLRGEKSRFQLFGDTVNTAARMESNGERNRIQVSQKTAELLKLAGKAHWLTPRKDKVDCKGKGMMSTFWCNLNASAVTASTASQSDAGSSEDEISAPLTDIAPSALCNRRDRLIDWNFDLFHGLLRDVVAQRSVTPKATSPLEVQNYTTSMPLDEVTEVLSLSKPKTAHIKPTKEADIPSSASVQLRDLIASIAKMYRSNPFHNFDHCSHVAMSTKKLLGRIAEHSLDSSKMSQCVEKSSHAITSNPLTQFAIVFAALIHDVDHQGVSNAQLVEEKCEIAISYQGKSVAEQNSVAVAWNLLMEERFADLRACMFPTKSEVDLFRQVVVNAVLATDLFDKNLKALRESRWQKSFHEKIKLGSTPLTEDDANRRATIVIDLIIQASDVSHTMQYFTVYKKWNRNLLMEMYEAHQTGRMTRNPLDGWYEGELWFFDNYVIPLAQKLRECGVFGVSCDEFLDYAKDNRMEWEMKGHDIVRDIAEELKSRAIQEASVPSTTLQRDAPSCAVPDSVSPEHAAEEPDAQSSAVKDPFPFAPTKSGRYFL